MLARRLLVGVTALVVASGLLSAGAATAGASLFRPGAPGVGDPYFPLGGNGGYDALHYALAITYDPATRVLQGQSRMVAVATQNLSSFDLDLRGLKVRAVTVDATAASWSRNGQELVVRPAHGIRSGTRFDVGVSYDGVPQPSIIEPFGLPAGWIATADGAVVASQPDGAATWFPGNDHPSDKATFEFKVTAPIGLQVLANGLPTGTHVAGAWATTTWSARDPMATYLATVVIGHYSVRRSTTAQGIPVIDAVAPGVGVDADAALARMGEILAFEQRYFGPYPFETAGNIVVDHSLGFALETQTRPVYDPAFFAGGAGSRQVGVVVHEYAHQWFGDSVALRRWSDIWLNEGFATYAEWLWSQHEHFASPARFFADWSCAPASSPVWNPPPGDPGATQLFADSTYIRGAMTLQALRKQIGDPVFFALIKRWATDRRNGHGTTGAFVALAQQLSGQQLGPFFQRWLFTPGKPPGLHCTG